MSGTIGVEAVDARDRVRVGEHHALRRAGGPGRVDEEVDVLATRPGPGRHLALPVGREAGAGLGAQVVGGGDREVVEVGLGRVRRVAAGADHELARLRAVGDPADRLGRHPQVQRHEDQAGPHGAEVDGGQLGARRRPGEEPVARLEPARAQPPGGQPAAPVQLAVAPGLLRAVVAAQAQRGPRRRSARRRPRGGPPACGRTAGTRSRAHRDRRPARTQRHSGLPRSGVEPRRRASGRAAGAGAALRAPAGFPRSAYRGGRRCLPCPSQPCSSPISPPRRRPSSAGSTARPCYDGPDLRLVLFAFAPGEELSEHTAARPAVVHVLDGEGEASVGGEPHPLGPGTWFRMPAGMPHSIRARTPLRMALYLLPPGD